MRRRIINVTPCYWSASAPSLSSKDKLAACTGEIDTSLINPRWYVHVLRNRNKDNRWKYTSTCDELTSVIDNLEIRVRIIPKRLSKEVEAHEIGSR